MLQVIFFLFVCFMKSLLVLMQESKRVLMHVIY